LWKEKPYLLKFAIWVLAGFVLTILPYAIYIFYASRNSNVSFLEQIHIAPSYTSVMGREILRWRSFLQLPFGIPVALIMFAGWLTAWWKATAEDKFIATITAVYPLSLIFCGTNALPDYLVAIIPCISILVVRFIYRLHEVDFFKGSRRIHYLVRLVVILIYITSSLPPTLFILYQQHNDDFNKVIDEIANVVGPKARVYGDPVFWVGHDRYIYGPYPINGYVITIKEGLQWVYLQSFDYVIRTTWDNSRPSQGFKRIPNKMPNFRIELLGDNICKLFGTKVYEFYNEYYGPVEIYKLDWSNAWKYRLEKRKIE
jgi:hypothetical protein